MVMETDILLRSIPSKRIFMSCVHAGPVSPVDPPAADAHARARQSQAPHAPDLYRVHRNARHAHIACDAFIVRVVPPVRREVERYRQPLRPRSRAHRAGRPRVWRGRTAGRGHGARRRPQGAARVPARPARSNACRTRWTPPRWRSQRTVGRARVRSAPRTAVHSVGWRGAGGGGRAGVSWRIVHGRCVYMDPCGPRVYGNSPGEGRVRGAALGSASAHGAS